MFILPKKKKKSVTITVQEIFWARSKSIKLFNNFSIILIMNSTYKANMYIMPLFEIVGNTSTDMIYSIAFAFMMFEKEDNFTWVLQKFFNLLNSKEYMSKII